MITHLPRSFPASWRRSVFTVAIAFLLAASVGCSSTSKRSVNQPFTARLGTYPSAAVEVRSTAAKQPARMREFLVQLENRIMADLRIQNAFAKIYSHAADPNNDARLGIIVTIASVRDVDTFDRVMWGAFAGQANTKATLEVREKAGDRLLGSAQVEGISSGGSVLAGTTGEAVDRLADEVVKIIVENR